jgi:hypothetical protein
LSRALVERNLTNFEPKLVGIKVFGLGHFLDISLTHFGGKGVGRIGPNDLGKKIVATFRIPVGTTPGYNVNVSHIVKLQFSTNHPTLFIVGGLTLIVKGPFAAFSASDVAGLAESSGYGYGSNSHALVGKKSGDSGGISGVGGLYGNGHW